MSLYSTLRFTTRLTKAICTLQVSTRQNFSECVPSRTWKCKTSWPLGATYSSFSITASRIRTMVSSVRWKNISVRFKNSQQFSWKACLFKSTKVTASATCSITSFSLDKQMMQRLDFGSLESRYLHGVSLMSFRFMLKGSMVGMKKTKPKSKRWESKLI